MTIRGRNALLLVIALVLSTGTVAAGYEVTAVTNGGALEGRVVFNGPKPPPRKIVPGKDKEVCGGPREAAQMVVSPDGAVAEAIVFTTSTRLSTSRPFTT